MTTVVNKKTYDGPSIYIGRGSLFGNPYYIDKDGDRHEVVELYRIWFYNRLKDPTFSSEVLKLKDKVLSCFCKPLACHGDIIAEYLDKS